MAVGDPCCPDCGRVIDERVLKDQGSCDDCYLASIGQLRLFLDDLDAIRGGEAGR